MWTYLKKLDSQHNTARRFHIEHELAIPQKGNLSTSDFYSNFMNICDEYTNIVYVTLSPEGFNSLQFEGTKSNLLNQEPIPSLNVCLNTLFCKEQRILTQITME